VLIWREPGCFIEGTRFEIFGSKWSRTTSTTWISSIARLVTNESLIADATSLAQDSRTV
jgi:hypothetical protein